MLCTMHPITSPTGVKPLDSMERWEPIPNSDEDTLEFFDDSILFRACGGKLLRLMLGGILNKLPFPDQCFYALHSTALLSLKTLVRFLVFCKL